MQRGWPCEDRGRDGRDASTSQGPPTVAGPHQEPGGGVKQIPSQNFWKEPTLETP